MDESDAPERRSYHHGNLREALVEATLGLIEEKGPSASPLPRPRARPASAPPPRTATSAAATS